MLHILAALEKNCIFLIWNFVLHRYISVYSTLLIDSVRGQ